MPTTPIRADLLSVAVDLVVEEAGWDELPLAKLSEASVSAVIRSLKIDADGASVAILACDDVRIAELNREFRAQPQATNVLAWPSRPHATRVAGTAPQLPQHPQELGDIAIAYGTCKGEAAAADIPFGEHVTHLLVHGLLHLLGYDHIGDENAALMEGLETEILATMGLQDPYS